MSVDQDETSSNHVNFFVKLRGFSRSATIEDIKQFLSPCEIVKIHRDDENENVFVELESEYEFEQAIKKNESIFLKQKIEIKPSDYEEFDKAHRETENGSLSKPVIRVSGVPITCTMADIQQFFQETSIAKNGIYISRDMSDNATGAAFLAFIDMENAERALAIYNGVNFQNRAIDLFPSSYEEAKRTIIDDATANAVAFAGEDKLHDDESEEHGSSREKSISSEKRSSRLKTRSRSNSKISERRDSYNNEKIIRNIRPKVRTRTRTRTRSRSPLSRPKPLTKDNEYRIKMRGMPFTVTRDDILDFFPQYIRPTRIEILIDRRTRKQNGDAYVYFSTREHIREALKRDRHYMGRRYVELYSDLHEKLPATQPRRHQSTRTTSIRPSRSNYRHRRSRS